MKRRSAIKTFMLASAAWSVPAWAQRWSGEDVTTFAPVLDQQELLMLATIADIIIPDHDGVGAISTDTHKYLARMISDCFEDDFQSEVKANLSAFSRHVSNSVSGRDMNELGQVEKEELLLAYADIDEDTGAFFNFIKSQAIRGFQTSEIVMVEYHQYTMAPGFYDGDVNV